MSLTPAPSLGGPITVALVEDEPGTRQRLARAIQTEPSLQLLHACGTAGEMLTWLEEQAVQVLLVDLGLPDGSGIQVIQECRRRQPACHVMVITMFGDEANMLAAFEAGASGYLLKDGTEADLSNHVHTLSAGGSPMSPVIARQLLTRWRSVAMPGEAVGGRAAVAVAPVPALTTEPLSRRETEVLDLISRGFTYPEISQKMAVSLATVHTHVRNIYGKLDVHNRSEAVFEARQLGLLP